MYFMCTYHYTQITVKKIEIQILKMFSWYNTVNDVLLSSRTKGLIDNSFSKNNCDIFPLILEQLVSMSEECALLKSIL